MCNVSLLLLTPLHTSVQDYLVYGRNGVLVQLSLAGLFLVVSDVLAGASVNLSAQPYSCALQLTNRDTVHTVF